MVGSELKVSVNRVFAPLDGSYDKDPDEQGCQEPDSVSGMDEPQKSVMHMFADGSSYRLPPGINLESCDLSGDELDRVVGLIQKQGFLKGTT